MWPAKKDDYIIRKIMVNNKPLFDLEGEKLDYATFGETHHGLQCNYDPDSEEYKKIMEHCAEIIKHIVQIDEILYKNEK
jgi:hypothetical protein